MTLAEYLAETDIKDEPFAEAVGVSRPMITKLRNRSTKPSTDLAMRIFNVTGGKVSLPDLMPLSAPNSGKPTSETAEAAS